MLSTFFYLLSYIIPVYHGNAVCRPAFLNKRRCDDAIGKTVMFGAMEGKNKIGRLHREWADDIENWCEDTLQKLHHFAHDGDGWRRRIKLTLEAD